MARSKNNNIVKFSIQTFFISLIISSFVYDSSGVTSALMTLQEGKFSIFINQLFSVSYIAAILTALIIVVYYFGSELVKPRFYNQADNTNRNKNYPELVIVNPNTTKEIIDKMNLSVN